MTTAIELGFSYNGAGDLVKPKVEVRLNEKGAQFVREFAQVFGYAIEKVKKGYEVKQTTWGINGTMITLLIPTVDQKTCSVNVSMISDYFLPPKISPANNEVSSLSQRPF